MQLRSVQRLYFVLQNARLRQQVDDQEATFARRLQAYQDGQQRQAQLVQKLQTKVCLLLRIPQLLRFCIRFFPPDLLESDRGLSIGNCPDRLPHF